MPNANQQPISWAMGSAFSKIRRWEAVISQLLLQDAYRTPYKNETGIAFNKRRTLQTTPKLPWANSWYCSRRLLIMSTTPTILNTPLNNRDVLALYNKTMLLACGNHYITMQPVEFFRSCSKSFVERPLVLVVDLVCPIMPKAINQDQKQNSSKQGGWNNGNRNYQCIRARFWRRQRRRHSGWDRHSTCGTWYLFPGHWTC